MPGCSLISECVGKDTNYCSPFSILGSICKDMKGMSACKPYVGLCEEGSVVKQCKSQPPLSLLRSGKVYKSLVKDICSEMNMNGCEQCDGKPCDSFKVYNKLCAAMPGMSQCDDYLNLCSRYKDFSFCPNDSGLSPGLGPTMKMYFHFGYSDYILFYDWVPNTFFTFMISCFGCVLLGVGYEFLLYQNVILEQRWSGVQQRGQDEISSASSTDPLLVAKPFPASGKIKLYRGLMRMVTVTGAYACMLIVMSYNIGLFVSIVTGLGIGAYFWGETIDLAGMEKEHCC